MIVLKTEVTEAIDFIPKTVNEARNNISLLYRFRRVKHIPHEELKKIDSAIDERRKFITQDLNSIEQGKKRFVFNNYKLHWQWIL